MSNDDCGQTFAGRPLPRTPDGPSSGLSPTSGQLQTLQAGEGLEA